MENIDIIIRKITPKEGFLLTDGEVTTNVLFVKNIPADGTWWEIPDPNYVPEFDGTDYLRPITYTIGLKIMAGLWYTDGGDIWEAIKTGIPADFNDMEYFDIIK